MTTHNHDTNNILDRTDLEVLKEEIISSLSQRRRPKLAWGSVTVTTVLGLLVLVSLAQTSQSVILYNNLKAGGAAAVVAPAVNSSPQNLPDQVGGC